MPKSFNHQKELKSLRSNKRWDSQSANQAKEAWWKLSWVVGAVLSQSWFQLFATPWTAACPASLSFTISRSLLKLMSIESMMPSNHAEKQLRVLGPEKDIRVALLLEFTQIHVHRVSDAIQLSHPLSSPSPPAPNHSQHQSLFHESTLRMRWQKYWSFSYRIFPSKEIPGLISFRTDWLDLLAGQGTLKSLLQHHTSKAPTRRRSAFFTVQLSHPYMMTGKTIALTRRTFAGKVMSLLFNMLCRFVIAFLLRDSCPQ